MFRVASVVFPILLDGDVLYGKGLFFMLDGLVLLDGKVLPVLVGGNVPPVLQEGDVVLVSSSEQELSL